MLATFYELLYIFVLCAQWIFLFPRRLAAVQKTSGRHSKGSRRRRDRFAERSGAQVPEQILLLHDARALLRDANVCAVVFLERNIAERLVRGRIVPMDVCAECHMVGE